MAAEKCCDRCKKFYIVNKGVRFINGNSVRGIDIVTSACPHCELDLCDDCIEELYKFLNVDEEDKK